MSSPFPAAKRTRGASDDEDEPVKRSVKRKVGGGAGAGRTREYETVAIVRRKIVFALR